MCKVRTDALATRHFVDIRDRREAVRAGVYSAPMSLTIRLLGTSASRPTVERNVSGLALVREGETLLFECGEGTQRQMMRYGVSFTLSEIFFTHFHADHFLGVIGLVRTLGLRKAALGRAAFCGAI